MENYTENSSELLHQMFDGELNPEMDDKLFSDLAHNSDMQTELNDMLKIRETISKDYEAFTPKEESKEAIFAVLGFSKIGAEVAATSVGAGAGVAAGFFAKAWIPVSSALVASLVTALIVVGVYENKENKIALKENSNTKIIVPITKSKEVDNIVKTSENNIAVNSQSRNQILKNKTTNKANNKFAYSVDNNVPTDINSVNIISTNSHNDIAEKIGSNNQISLPTSIHEEMMPLPIINKDLAIISIASPKQVENIRSLNLRNSESVSLLPILTSNDKLSKGKNTGSLELSLLNNGNLVNTNNMSIGYNLAPLNLYSYIGSNIEVVPGIKLGRSEFMIAYSQDNGNTIPSELKSIFYLAGQVRLELQDLELIGFTPFVQGQFGYSNGTISKEMIGLAFDSPLNIAGTNIIFLAGYEFSQFNQSTVSNVSKTKGFNLIGVIKF